MADPMHTIDRIEPLRALVADWRRQGLRVGLVPTMGNLHRGHLELVRVAHGHAERVVTSVFVNPLQFGPAEDFARYPRTLGQDAELLRGAGNHCLFAPPEDEVYPRGRDDHTAVEVPGLSDLLCGASRPGHFRGVATVVAKLFNMVQPDVAVFGRKDFQQLAIIRRMTEDLNLPIAIVGVPIVREPDGLALSSRNGYLSAAERALAPRLHGVLQRAVARLTDGAEVAGTESQAVADLTEAGFRPDYVSVRRRADLGPAAAGDCELVILAAAYLGRTRLIDNVPFERPRAV